MNQERYWRNLIADEIKAEHDKVKTYYQKKGMNNGGMSSEEHTRLNIFLLCESICRTMRNNEEYVEDISTPEVLPDIPDNLIKDTQEMIEPPAPKPAKKTAAKKTTPKDPIHKLVKDTPQQNEFGEIL